MRSNFEIVGLDIPSGQMLSRLVKVNNEDYEIPFFVINGANDGKVFLATAGVHGCEYPGVQSLIELSKEIDPTKVNGAIVLIPLINPAGFYGRQPFVCPVDEERKNFNRIFPGNKNGTLADRVAAWITEEVISKCDFHVDIHSGDIVEDLEEFVAICNASDPNTKRIAEEAAKHTCFMARIYSGGKTEFYNSSSITLNKPALMFERGGKGEWDREKVDRNKFDLISIMQFMKILPGEPKDFSKRQVFYKNHHWGEAGFTGLFYKFVQTGDNIKKGQKIGEIRDINGDILEEIFANFDGHIKISNTTLGISKGDDTFMYGSI